MQYTNEKGMSDKVYTFMMAKVIEVEDIQETFTRNAIKITEGIREQLDIYVPNLTNLDILGTFDVLKELTEVQFKVGARISAKVDGGPVSESLWVFHFSGTKIIKTETLQIVRDAIGTFVPVISPLGEAKQ
jgi:hypothetical protein